MKKVFRKLGVQVVMIVIIMLAAALLSVNIIALTMLRGFADDILTSKAVVGRQVLEETLKDEISTLEHTHHTLTDNRGFIKAVAERDLAALDRDYFSLLGAPEDFFMVVSDFDGRIIYHSDSYYFGTYDFGGTQSQIYLNSVVQRDDKLAVMAADQFSAGGEDLILAIGFKLSESTWLENVKNGVGCDVTIFNGNLRYSTTLGADYIGTAMSDEVKTAVLDNGTVYNGQVVIKDEPYYVSYSPMYDVNHTLVGAYFAGINVSDVNREFSFVRLLIILSGVVIGAVCVIIVMRFAYKQITVPINKVTALAREMQDGKLGSSDVSYKFADNEVGDFAKVLEQTKKSLHLVVNDASVILNNISNGVLDKKPEVRYPGDFEIIRESILKIDDNLAAALNEITEMTSVNERISAELGIATKIQADMLPTDFPDNEKVSLYAAMTPAREVGGDFYDFFFIDDRHLALVMADVAGKGVPAALLCVVTKAVLRDNTMAGGSPAEILGRVNRIVAANSGGLFVTVWLGILDLDTGVVDYCNAGHEYPIVCRENGGIETIRKESFPPLAALDEMEFENETLTLGKGDSLFLYTDGVPEAKAAVGTRFGMERLVKVLERSKNKTPEQTVTAVKRKVDNFQPENEPFDDVTMMCVLWNGSDRQ